MSSTIPKMPDVQEEDPVIQERRARNLRAAALLRAWRDEVCEEDPDYDERVSALLDLELSQDGLRFGGGNDSAS